MRRRHRRLTATADLDITAFLNLMIVLVPVLLLGMVFSQIRMIELNFPGLEMGEAPEVESFRLVVTVLPDGMELTDSDRGVIEVLPAGREGQNYARLSTLLQGIKSRLPDKTDITLEVGPDIDYQTLVSVMDTVRSYPAVVAASVVQAELFPEISLMDAGEARELAARPAEVKGEGV
ncbi:biopolymer transporter ExbD [Marinobacter daepoensis]|uniref:ExbD/TolR family protein n=1 Tax=Marinobacter daepoensis TaxID=262077 RepID=UPI001C98DEEF|nr:biopolymer transporter ExbD [Marinobacter daepoensis]MBY6032484.1 biopolymer transporter ExbD [Marinobacter daepoensis]